eukprot:2114044-Ditylum_brightwellii.AAC.1
METCATTTLPQNWIQTAKQANDCCAHQKTVGRIWDLWNHKNRWIEAGKTETAQDMILSLQECICLHCNK